MPKYTKSLGFEVFETVWVAKATSSGKAYLDLLELAEAAASPSAIEVPNGREADNSKFFSDLIGSLIDKEGIMIKEHIELVRKSKTIKT